MTPSGEASVSDDFEDHCWKDVFSAEDLEIYRRYRRDAHIGRKPGLLAVDLFNKAYQGGPGPVREIDRRWPGACGDFAWDAIDPTKTLLEAARARDIPVIYTTVATGPGALRATQRLGGSDGVDPWGVRSEFAPRPNDLIVYKERASAFFGTTLQARLRLAGVDALIVCGQSTSGCVRASVVDGYSHGFHVSVVEECTFDRSLLCHKVNLFDMHHKYADVMSLPDVLAELERRR